MNLVFRVLYAKSIYFTMLELISNFRYKYCKSIFTYRYINIKLLTRYNSRKFHVELSLTLNDIFFQYKCIDFPSGGTA